MSSSPEDFFKSIEEEVQATQDAAKHRSQTLAQGRDLISEQMPTIWTQLYEEFQSYCEAYNKDKKTGMLVFSLGTSYLFVVRKDGKSDALTGLYDPSTKQIKLEANNCQYADWLLPKVRLGTC